MALSKFASFLLLLLLLVLLIGGAVNVSSASFNQNYYMTWGYNHVTALDKGQEIQLSMDASSGSGFASKKSYGSGFFNMEIKLPGRNSAGAVTAFYLSSHGDNRHDEVDFEFLGNREGKPITLQTNVYADGVGNREQRILLWFDPTADFHSYQVLWNHHQIVFYVDDIPIRVFKNNEEIGVPYLTRPMRIEASMWNGESWATDGGRTKIDWSYAPFQAYYRGFDISGCECQSQDTSHCYSSAYWWNSWKRWVLDKEQDRQLEDVKKNFMNYDYCTDRSRHPVPSPECHDSTEGKGW